ncbi:DUF7548 family protein [Halopelagius longus]|uniref:Uncharacterized protein n=1 Tax=Halopelagius longus TaxID=1236180 RepID=A0A1H1BX04_9EURY|nr:hypothetical protein [Halopelagius longus]RDI70944.1 hypothetical protein DWB78_03930 [Halopelagius longus]SDQ55946.1 hypothetical protein SAMN05216278_1976 [Halopelagius longus]
MNTESVASAVGAVACLLLAALVFAPALLVTQSGVGVAAYYAAGPVGISVVGFLGLLGVVVFLAGRGGRTDPVTVAGLVVVVGLAMLGFALLWAVSIDSTLVFSFPPEYAWIENHRWAVVAVAAVVAVSAAAYARGTLK